MFFELKEEREMKWFLVLMLLAHAGCRMGSELPIEDSRDSDASTADIDGDTIGSETVDASVDSADSDQLDSGRPPDTQEDVRVINPASAYGVQCQSFDQRYISDPPDQAPACTACINLREQEAADAVDVPEITSPLYVRDENIESFLNIGSPLSGYDQETAQLFTARVTGGEYEDIIYRVDREDAQTLGYTSLVRVSSDGFGEPERLTDLLDVERCLGSAELSGDDIRKELICTTESEVVIYRGSFDGYHDHPALKRVIPIPGQPPTHASVIDLNGDGLPEIVLSRWQYANVVLCQTEEFSFVNCTEDVGMENYGGMTFFTTPFPCNPADLASSNICLFETNDNETHSFVYRVVRSEADPYGFHLEEFDPLDQTEEELLTEPYIPDACDRMTISSCPDWLGLDGLCPDWIFQNLKSMARAQGIEIADSLLTLAALDGPGQTDPMGFGCSVFAGDQLCCAVAETAGPGADLMLCHQGGDTWRMVHGIGLTKRLTSHGHFTKGWGTGWITTGRWDKDLLIVNGEESGDEAQSSIQLMANILGDLVPGYEDNPVPGPAYVGYYRRLPNLALDEQSEAAGFTAGSGSYGTQTTLWLPTDSGIRQHLVLGKWADGFEVFRLDKPEGNFVRIRLNGDDGSDRNGMLSKIVVTDGEHRCAGFLGTERAQPHVGPDYNFVCGVGSAETVSVTVMWFPSLAHPSGHTTVYEDVSADSVLTILYESGGRKIHPPAL